MKKAVSIFLIIVILINLITVKSFAEPTSEVTTTTTPTLIDSEDAQQLIKNPADYFKRIETQTTTITNADGRQKKESTTGTTYMSSTIFGILGHILGSIPQITNQFLESTLEVIGGEGIQHFTIYDTVMGHFELFNVAYHDVPSAIDNSSSICDILKYNVRHYYSIIRNISIALILFVLLYTGIRMAVATLADDKARFKKALLGWLSSLIILFLMHFIVVIVSMVLGWALDTINNFSTDMSIKDAIPVNEIESQIFTDASVMYETAKGWNMIAAIITMWIIIYYQVKFFTMYIGRIIEIGFLIMVSPIVMVTSSINKANSGKAQAFNTWVKELTSKASIQIIHAILYLIFIASAGLIATEHPILAAAFFALLSRSEKIFKNALNVKNNEFEKAKVRTPFSK